MLSLRLIRAIFVPLLTAVLSQTRRHKYQRSQVAKLVLFGPMKIVGIFEQVIITPTRGDDAGHLLPNKPLAHLCLSVGLFFIYTF